MISKTILIQFRTNLKVIFVGISLTGDDCLRNICSGCISLGMIQHSGIGIICKFILVSALALDFHSLLLLFVSVCGKLENTISYVHKSQHACAICNPPPICVFHLYFPLIHAFCLSPPLCVFLSSPHVHVFNLSLFLVVFFFCPPDSYILFSPSPLFFTSGFLIEGAI